MLTIRLLGEMAVLRGGEPLALPPSKKTRALLAYLVATGRPQRRERLCTLLWEVPDDPRGALRWSVSKLRALVDEPGGEARILADRESIAFAAEGAACDLRALRELAAVRPLDAAPLERLRAVAEEVRGDFLEGLDLPAQPDFQAWCVAEREDARRRHAAVLHALVARFSPGAPEEALPHARRLAGLDPFDARARAALVDLLVRASRRGEAEQHLKAGLAALREAGMPAGDLARAARDLRSGAAPGRAAARTEEEEEEEEEAAPAAPACVPSGPAAPGRVPEGAAAEARRIVIVDDEPELGRMVAEYLDRHGFAVRTAVSGCGLDALLAADPADLVVLDVNLPGEDGFAIARRLRAGAATAPRILFLTAAADVVDRVVGLELGAADYLTKPFDLRELRARIQVALRRTAAPPRDAERRMAQEAGPPPSGPAASEVAPEASASAPPRAVPRAAHEGGGDPAVPGQSSPVVPVPARPVESRPSLAVLPFLSLSDEPGQDLLADGMAEDLITALSRIRWFHVIGRNSSFTYKGRTVPAPQVGRELGVRYVVEGVVRRAADRVRVTVQLVEVETGTPVWADRFDGTTEDVFGLQDRVVARIVGALEPSLRRAEVARLHRQPPTAVPRAYEAYLRATARMHPMTEANCAAALELLEQALAQDRGFALALAAAAWCRMWRVAQDFTGEVTPEEEVRTIALAEAAVAAAPDDPAVLAQAALVFAYFAHRRQAALAFAERAVELHPNSALARSVAGWVQLYDGRAEAAIPHFAEALRLDPLDPAAGEPMAGTAMAHLLAGRLEAAIEWGERAVAASPERTTAHRALVAALGVAGRPAGVAAGRMLALAPGFTVAGYARLRHRHAEHPLSALVNEGLRRAGVPEGPKPS